jgi:hypothetical protein
MELILKIIIAICMLLTVLFGIGIVCYAWKEQEERVKEYERERKKTNR